MRASPVVTNGRAVHEADAELIFARPGALNVNGRADQLAAAGLMFAVRAAPVAVNGRALHDAPAAVMLTVFAPVAGARARADHAA